PLGETVDHRRLAHVGSADEGHLAPPVPGPVLPPRGALGKLRFQYPHLFRMPLSSPPVPHRGKVRLMSGRKLRRIGLTGGIASGKSEVSRLLAAKGVPVVDADALAREAVEPGSSALAR